MRDQMMSAPVRILAADDEDGSLSLMVTALTYADFTVIPVRDGLEALLRARESPPDIALLDVMMPGMDGREVCRRMAADPALTHVPVILHSAADERDIDWRGCGADAFLRKPFNIRDLPDVIRRHLCARATSDRPRARRLTDDEILEIAHRIREAVRHPPDPDPRDGILSPYRELSHEDETRVEAALLTLLRPAEQPSRPDPRPGRASPTGARERGEGER